MKYCHKVFNLHDSRLKEEQILNKVLFDENIIEENIININTIDDYPFFVVNIFYKESI